MQIAPPKLSGDKWFSRSKDVAASYAKLGYHQQPQWALFQVFLQPKLVAQELAPGAWFSAVQTGSGIGWAIERHYIRAALTARFGADIRVAGLYKPASPTNCQVPTVHKLV